MVARMQQKKFEQIHLIVAMLFHVLMVYAVYAAYVPFMRGLDSSRLWDLLSAQDKSFDILGSEFAPFRNKLPSKGRFSVIMDHPFGEDPQEEKLFLEARNFLAPLLLNEYPKEPVAIVFCSSMALANQRLAETGYQWSNVFSPGKGIAVKGS